MSFKPPLELQFTLGDKPLRFSESLFGEQAPRAAGVQGRGFERFFPKWKIYNIKLRRVRYITHLTTNALGS